MSQISAEKLNSVSHSPPPGTAESLLHLFHLDYPEIQTRQQMSGFLNDHQIPEILARSIENGLLPTNGVRTELLFRRPLGEIKPQEIVVRSPSGSADSNIRTGILPHPSFAGVRLVQIGCEPRHDRQVFLSFGIDEDYQLVPENLVPMQAFDTSGNWENRNRKVEAYYSAAADDIRQDPQVVISVFHIVVAQAAVVPNPKAETAGLVKQQPAETIGQLALSSAI